MAKSRDAKSNESSGPETAKSKPSARGATGDSGGRGSMTGPTADAAAKVMDQTAEVLGHAQEQAASIVNMASQQATSQLGLRKDLAASTLGVLASALHEASQQMRQQDETAIAGYIDSAAGQIEQVSTMLREQDINQIINTTAQFARRQPALFLAGALALGFIGTRFLKSSSPSGGQSFGSASYGMSRDWDRSRGDAYSSGSWSGGYGTASGLGSGYSGAGGSSGFAGSSGASGFNSGIRSSSAMGAGGAGSNAGFGSGDVGSSGAMGSGSGMGSSSTASAGRQEGFSGTARPRAGSDWSSRDSDTLGSEGS
jgi:hypothetical protein